MTAGERVAPLKARVYIPGVSVSPRALAEVEAAFRRAVLVYARQMRTVPSDRIGGGSYARVWSRLP